MEGSHSQDALASDSAYSPQILNEVDQPMGGTEEQIANGHSNNNGARSHYISQSADYPQSNYAQPNYSQPNYSQPVYPQTNYPQSNHPLSPPLDSDPNSRYSSPTLAYQQQPNSRPGSGLSGQQGYQGQYQTQYQDQSRQQPTPSKSSVVIKVGMVGDAQIGKTSLMVKYVEGSWDEDYIQTLGECGLIT